MKLKFVFVIAIFSLCANVFAQDIDDFSAQSANRQTALRYLRLAKSYAMQSEWQKCATAAEAGNNYDKTVADLWYLMALSRYNTGTNRKSVLPLLQNSLSGAEWVDYNKSTARIFFADLLCATGRPRAALQVLDQKPFIYSADAEFVRVKAYYTIGDAENVKHAREKVDVSRRIYPSDARFAHLFFAYEYRIMYTKNYAAGMFDYMPLSGQARKTADYFIARVPEYDSRDVELEIYAAIFAEGEQKSRLLRAFNARGFKSPMFAAAALEDGVISDSMALEYFLDFMEKSGKNSDNHSRVTLFELERFASVLKDEEAKKNFAVYLNAYTGTLYSDTDSTLESNLAVSYSRGRPEQIRFDSDNDGVEDWYCDLDFGVPRAAHFEDKKISVYYGTYPSPVRIVFEEVPGEEGNEGSSTTIFNLADETVDAEIFKIKTDEFVLPVTEFFVVDEKSLWSGNRIFDQDQLIVSVNSMEKPSKERDGAMIHFLMLDGVPYAADYLVGEKLYAHAQFTTPLVRNVDRDGDGIFETTEIYAQMESNVVVSKADLDAASQNIWGSPAPNPARYLKMIQIDRNNDTRPDFTEEYLTHGGRISTWDLDYDGEWDSRHTIFPQGEGEARSELTEIFVMNIKEDKNAKSLVSIKTISGEPKEILLDGQSVAVTKGSKSDFYWIGIVGTESQEMNVRGFMKNARSGAVDQIEEKDCYIQALFIDGEIFARILNKQQEPTLGTKEANESKNEGVENN